MRTLLLSLCFSSALTVGAIAQTPSHYTYVEIRGLAQQRGVPELTMQLKSIPAVDSVLYCENAGLAIIHTKTPASDSRRSINQLLHSLNYHYVIKSEIPIEEATKICFKHSRR